jgi:hypothetical protein
MLYPQGSYKCKITQQRFGRSPAKGTPAFELTFKVLASADDPDTAVASEFRTQQFWITPNTLTRVVEDLQRLVSADGEHWAGRKISELDPRSNNHFSFYGWEVILYCRQGEDNKGKTREEWSPRGSTLLPLDPHLLDEFDAALAGSNTGIHVENNTDGKSALVPAQTGVTLDDVPF